MLRFGANITGFDVVNYFARNGDHILVGRVWGSEALGLYSKAYQLLMLPITMLRGPVTSVAMPAMSRLSSDPVRYRDYYLRLVGGIAFLSMPLVAIMFVCSDSVIYVLLGAHWMAASPVFRVLAFAALVTPIYTTGGLVLLSRGMGAQYLVAGTGNTLAMCCGFAIGVQYGALGVAVAYAVTNLAAALPLVWYCTRGTCITLVDVGGAVVVPFLFAVASGMVTYLVAVTLGTRMAGAGSLGAALAGVAAYLGLWCSYSRGRARLNEYLRRLMRASHVSQGLATCTRRADPGKRTAVGDGKG